MGNSNASASEKNGLFGNSEGQNDGPPINTKDYNYISNVFDERYGEVKIMKHIQSNELIALSTRVLNSDTHLKRMLSLFTHAQKHQYDYIVNLIAFQQTKKEEFCGSFYKIQAVFEYLTNNIQKDMAIRNKYPSNPFIYTLAELLHIAKHTLLALQEFKNNGYSHSDLRPSNILIDAFGRVKLLDYSMLPGTVTGYANLLMGASDKCYLAPELLAKLRHRDQNPVHNPYKGEVFSLGISLIEAANFTDASHCYEIGDYVVNEQEIAKEINKTGIRYGSEFENLLRHMLVINELKRCSIEEALQAIGLIEKGGSKVADKLGEGSGDLSNFSLGRMGASQSHNESVQSLGIRNMGFDSKGLEESRKYRKDEEPPYKDIFYYSLDDYHPPEGISKTSFFVDRNGSPQRLPQQEYRYETPKDPGSNFNPVTLNSNSTLERNQVEVNLFAGGMSTHDGTFENEKRFVTFQQDFDSDKGKLEDFNKFGATEDRYEKLISSQGKVEAFRIVDERQYNLLENEVGKHQTKVPAAGIKENNFSKVDPVQVKDTSKFINSDTFEFVSTLNNDSKLTDLSNQDQQSKMMSLGLNISNYPAMHSLNSNPSQTLNPDYYTSEKNSRFRTGEQIVDSNEFNFSRPVSLKPDTSVNYEPGYSQPSSQHEGSYGQQKGTANFFNREESLSQKSSRVLDQAERTIGTPLGFVNKKTEVPYPQEDNKMDRVSLLLKEMKNSRSEGALAGVGNPLPDSSRKSYSQRVEELLKSVNTGKKFEETERNYFPKVSQLLESERFGNTSGFLKKSGYGEVRTETFAVERELRKFDDSARGISPFNRGVDLQSRDYEFRHNSYENQPFGIYSDKV